MAAWCYTGFFGVGSKLYMLSRFSSRDIFLFYQFFPSETHDLLYHSALNPVGMLHFVFSSSITNDKRCYLPPTGSIMSTNRYCRSQLPYGYVVAGSMDAGSQEEEVYAISILFLFSFLPNFSQVRPTTDRIPSFSIQTVWIPPPPATSIKKKRHWTSTAGETMIYQSQ